MMVLEALRNLNMDYTLGDLQSGRPDEAPDVGLQLLSCFTTSLPRFVDFVAAITVREA